ncbi:MAG: tetratricopeptide repeat protein [Parasphingorhabdus sp.]|uniref:tetratricopeptide repeat protein n=1 Tax=Parasphingorhabdus sp. TaxID=2709688 RepID=UPI003297E5C6
MKFCVIMLAALVSFVVGSTAQASPDLKFGQPGQWVEIADLDQILEDNPNSEAVLVILDQQEQLQPGKVTSYRDVAVRIDSAKTMSSMMSLFRPIWHPDQGDLTVHRYEIVRGSEIIDLTAIDGLFEVIRREKDLERQQVNGMLTAISQIENLQLDDIVRMSFTVTEQNEALADRVQSSGGFVTATVKIDFNRQLVRWPKKMKVKWRGSKEEIIPAEEIRDGWNILDFDYRPEEPPVKIPKNAPSRFKRGNYFEVTSFASWKDVSRVNAALYSFDDGIVAGGDLDQEIAAIAKTTSDKKKRMALALQLVQDKVRYLYNGLGFGNYTPQTPEKTWQIRYGDCKAKTYLLMAILRRLGIEAVPMLVSTSSGDTVVERLPTFQAFNHVIVKARLDGKVYWLDGTGSGTRLSDLGDSPSHRFGLPSLKSGSELEEIPIRRPGRAFQMASVTYDLTAGTHLPATFSLQAMLRDRDAIKLKEANAQLSDKKAKEMRKEVALRYVLDGLISETEFTYDDENQTGYLTAKGLSYLDWENKADQREHELWSMSETIKIQKSRDEEKLRDLPVRLGYPNYFKYHVTYNLPDRYAAAKLSGTMELDEELGGYRFNRSVRKMGNQVVSKEEYYNSRWELPAAEFELERQQLALVKRKNVKITLPANDAKPWQETARYKSSAGIEIHRQAFDNHVVLAKADDDSALTNRAYFFQTIGEYDRAIADLQAAIAIESSAENYKWIGDLQLGPDPEGAIASYRAALEIKPAYFSALLELIRLHVRREEFKEAQSVLDQAKKNGLSGTSVDSLEIEILQADGKFEKALGIINALVDEDPDDDSYLADRCMLRAMENIDLDAALEDCTNAIELAKRSAYYHFVRGLVHYRKGDFQRAVKDFDKSLKANDRSGYVYKFRAAAHGKMGDAAASADDLQAATYYYKYAGWYWGYFID